MVSEIEVHFSDLVGRQKVADSYCCSLPRILHLMMLHSTACVV